MMEAVRGIKEQGELDEAIETAENILAKLKKQEEQGFPGDYVKNDIKNIEEYLEALENAKEGDEKK
jgi:hypothetical protein